MIARLAGRRCVRTAVLLALSGGLFACAGTGLFSPPPRDVLLEQFRTGKVELDCGRCRYDFRGADWLLEDGHYEPLVLGILRSRDGSGRSWYLLGRVAEATESPELALLYYRESLATSRQPIIALWPLYEDVNYRIRRLMSQSPAEPAPPARAESGSFEKVNVESLAVGTRPGSVGAFMTKLQRGDAVEVLDRSGDWEQVRLADGRVGWVWGAYTSVSGEPESPAPVAPPRVARKPIARKRPSAPSKTVASRPAPAATESAAAPRLPLASARPAPRKIAAARPALTALLAAPGSAGMLGCPLPQGASLAGRSHGSAGSDDHPTETYAIEAPASVIAGFYEREMERAGWQKALVSSELLLYFVKDDETIGILIEPDGGSFTLMGS